MALGLNEIRSNARQFILDWEDAESEDAEAQSFWEAFFRVFGVTRRKIGVYERHVTKLDGSKGKIDLFVPGQLIVEHKSKGKSLAKAEEQALDYLAGIKDHEYPRYLLTTDFAEIHLIDLEDKKTYEFTLRQLPEKIELFGFLSGYKALPTVEQDPVNIKAAERLGKLHDLLLDSGYDGTPLEAFLVRVLFCCFGEDTYIFPKSAFSQFIREECLEDGSDLGIKLSLLFQILNTPDKDKVRDSFGLEYKPFRYINGDLFAESLPIPATNKAMRDTLLACCDLDWTRVSPAIFGSLFQSIMDPVKRRDLGAHYTSETHILRALGPLFLDSLHEELAQCGRGKAKLKAFQEKLGNIRVLDPACGCGNFLVVAFREIRRLELDVLARLGTKKGNLFVQNLLRIDVDQFYGIEIEEFPSQIARVALWLTDHQMNMEAWVRFGAEFYRLPLRAAPTIRYGNALTESWESLVNPKKLTYIVGNPPFVGGRMVKGRLREEVDSVFEGVKSKGLLDYVACWYLLAAKYMQKNPSIRCAFVSTNSISQGEQPGVLWPQLFELGVCINFAHRTFQWDSEASGKAAVHCVIVGFALEDDERKRLFDYEDPKGEPHEKRVDRINPYLVDGPMTVLARASKPICESPEFGIGNKPIDGGHYLFTEEEMQEFIAKEPASEAYFWLWVGAKEFIQGEERWCLWLGDASPSELRAMPEVMKRIRAVREFRLKSSSKPTRELAETPTRFHVENMPSSDYLVIPEVSSERRRYIPMGFLSLNVISSNLVRISQDADIYDFGILTSTMHMAWVRALAGRLESRYRYSIKIVYNNFPWPESATKKQRESIEAAAQGVLDARAAHPNSSLADLYDPDSMPKDLNRAHKKLDQAVDKAYRRKKFDSEADRVAFLLERYVEITGTPLFEN